MIVSFVRKWQGDTAECIITDDNNLMQAFIQKFSTEIIEYQKGLPDDDDVKDASLERVYLAYSYEIIDMIFGGDYEAIEQTLECIKRPQQGVMVEYNENHETYEAWLVETIPETQEEAFAVAVQALAKFPADFSKLQKAIATTMLLDKDE
jgi:hypothetical protein